MTGQVGVSMRIAIPSSPFRPAFASGALTQLEWVERCASVLAADGIVPDIADFPRTDGEYLAQLRKAAIDLALVPFALDAPGLLTAGDDERAAIIAVAAGLGVACIRTRLGAPGDVPPAAFVAAVAAGKATAKAAKAINATLLLEAASGTLAEDLDAVQHLIRDVDSAWLRACPAVHERTRLGPRDRIPAFTGPLDAAAAERGWLIAALTPQEAEERLNHGGRSIPG